MNDEVRPYPAAAAAPANPRAPRPSAVAGVAAASAALVAVTIWTRYATQSAGTPLLLDIAVGALGCVLAPLLLWRPVTGAVGLVVLAALSPAATPPATLAALQVAQRRPLPVALAVAAAGVAAHAVQGLWQPNSGLSYGWWLVLITVGYGAMVGWGALARANRALVESLRERARRAEAEQGRRVAEARMAERTRMAREMHDVLAHRLSLLATYAGALEYRPDSPPERLSRAAGVVRAGVHQALEELREVILVLRDEDAAQERDHAAGRQPRLADIPDLVEESREAGVRVRLRDEVTEPDELPASLGRTAYRVVQEGLTNARKHAPGSEVDVGLTGRPGEGLEVVVANGVAAAGPRDGVGPVADTERVADAGRVSDAGRVAETELRADAGPVTGAGLAGDVGPVAAGEPAAGASGDRPEPAEGGTAKESGGTATGAGRAATGSASGRTAASGAAAVVGSGTGLVGLTERVQLAGGRLDHGRSGGRFRLHARLPWPA